MRQKVPCLLLFAVLALQACAVSTDETADSTLEAHADELSSSPTQVDVQISPIGTPPLLSPTPVDVPPLELKPCNFGDLATCQTCQDNCETGICSTPEGDVRSGSCVGSFCPNKCNVCILSCSQIRSCVRCYGR